MAQIINVAKEKPVKPILSGQPNSDKKVPLFRKTNYLLMAAGVLVLIAGYICLTGGGSDDPAVFSEKIFDARRLIVAPVLIVLGLAIEIVAIMYYSKKKAN